MLDVVRSYYAGERQTALVGVGSGVALLVLALILWRASAAASIGRGMACALLVVGALHAVASGGYAAMLPGREAATLEVYAGRSDGDVKQREIARVEGVLGSGYAGGIALFTALVLVGVALVLVSHELPVRKGVALALMIAGVLGHCTEAFSMQKNHRYLDRVGSLDE
jgi:hypothetical protein